MTYTPEQRALYPYRVGFILTKNKRDYVVDEVDVPKIIEAINSKGFVWLTNYQCTIHSFDIDEISIVKTKDDQRKVIDKLIKLKEENDGIPTNSLSLNQSIQGLKDYQRKSLMM